MNNKFKLSLTAAALAQCLTLATAVAQENTDTNTAVPADETEVITVRGFGSTLTKSLQHKKLADSTVEIISTDDLGQLPDVTITDALARLPGIAADRDRGNASIISIRGLGPRLNLATMNGREIVSGEPSRSVRYEQFPAELISSVEVFKSPMANQTEGGISGLVNMNFVEPLSKDERQLTISGHLMDYPLADDIPTADAQGKRGSFSIVEPVSDTLGFAFGIAYQDQPSVQRETTSYSYNKVVAEQGDVNDNGITEAAPWGGKSGTKGGNTERVGTMGVVQWIPTDSLEVKYNLFYSKFDIEEREDQLWFDGWGNWANGSVWNYQNSATTPEVITKADGSEQLVAGGMLWGAHSVNNATWFQENELISTGLNLDWQGDVWTVNADIGFSTASITSRWVNLTSDYTGPTPVDIGWDVTGDSLAITSDVDISNPDYYTLNGMTVDKDRELEDDMLTIKLDFSRYIDWGHATKFSYGVRWSDREKDNSVISWWQGVTGTADSGYASSYALGGGLVSPDIYTINDWQGTVDQAFGGIDDRSNHEPTNDDLFASWNLQETNKAAYFMFNLEGEMFGVPYTGNAGVRYVHTSSTSAGVQQNEEGFAPVSVDHSYTEILPSLNLRVSITEDSQIRVGLARTMSRPPLIEMRTGFQLNTQSEVKTASGGNPSLDPFVADQIDLGYEHFFSEDTAFTFSVFFKDLKTHVGTSTDVLTLDGVDYQFSGPVNGDGGQIRGFEVMYQQAFSMLPSPFDGLGIYTNYSFTDSNVTEFTPAENPLPMGGLSEHVGSLTLWYYKAGVDAKVSYNYRSEYTRVGSWEPTEIYTIDDEATVDASISYEVTENFKLMLQGQNLTNQVSHTYFDNDPSRVGSYVEWGRRYLVGFQYSM